MKKTTISDKWTAVVYAAYAHDQYNQGDVISRHKTYEAAQRAARRVSGWRGVSLVVDILEDRRLRQA